jgi:hypothetical protein
VNSTRTGATCGVCASAAVGAPAAASSTAKYKAFMIRFPFSARMAVNAHALLLGQLQGLQVQDNIKFYPPGTKFSVEATIFEE